MLNIITCCSHYVAHFWLYLIGILITQFTNRILQDASFQLVHGITV